MKRDMKTKIWHELEIICDRRKTGDWASTQLFGGAGWKNCIMALRTEQFIEHVYQRN